MGNHSKPLAEQSRESRDLPCSMAQSIRQDVQAPASNMFVWTVMNTFSLWLEQLEKHKPHKNPRSCNSVLLGIGFSDASRDTRGQFVRICGKGTMGEGRAGRTTTATIDVIASFAYLQGNRFCFASNRQSKVSQFLEPVRATFSTQSCCPTHGFHIGFQIRSVVQTKRP